MIPKPVIRLSLAYIILSISIALCWDKILPEHLFIYKGDNFLVCFKITFFLAILFVTIMLILLRNRITVFVQQVSIAGVSLVLSFVASIMLSILFAITVNGADDAVISFYYFIAGPTCSCVSILLSKRYLNV